MSPSLQGQRIFVTGGSSGIGRGICERLGRENARVAVGFHSGDERAEQVAETIREAGGEAITVPADVSEENDVEVAFAQIGEAFGGLDSVVINAGLQADASLAEMSLDQWRKVMSVDLDGAFLVARAAVRHFQRRERDETETVGKLVFVSSVHEFIPWACHVNYASAKGGVEMLMKSIAQEVASKGIRANGIAPGAIKTPINEDVWSDEEKLEELLKIIPFGRLGETEDVAAAAAWLLSDESDYVTGTTLIVDGGMSLYPGFIGNG
ncbi:SDR family oxidoreductase [Parvularcula sp. ZS-1/3]|uniref:SDR family oxidoreductase n=1 Tax=Parvularcula mediterranea TaxID=2732508 RepID=A0A7Y3RIY9_9PROT|nr:SDR family oxidoreductase [Parvularcula mediterranea]NNU14935.1 SDR family oxidoreductase [Parvularcula mediterranea]